MEIAAKGNNIFILYKFDINIIFNIHDFIFVETNKKQIMWRISVI